jgi:hypothetical protein
LTAFKSTKAPGQYSTGTGGQYSIGANTMSEKESDMMILLNEPET